MSVPQVSVIMPAHNVECYIDEAIQSVLSQRGLSFELLVGDDASSDRTWARIQNHLSDSRVRAWKFRFHVGAAVTRNRLIKCARGRYLLFCDSDDALADGHLSSLVPVLERDATAGVAYGDILIWDESTGRRNLRRRQMTDAWDLFTYSIGGPGILVRRELVNRVGGFRSELPLLHDYDLLLRLAEVTRFRYCPGAPFYFYRQRPSSLTDRGRNLKDSLTKKIRREAILRRYGYRVPW